MRYLILLLPLVLVACSTASAPSPTTEPPETPIGGALEQLTYNLWLETTREIVAGDPALACEADTRHELAGVVVSAEQDPALFDLAFLDACKEVGMIPYPGDFSPYYPD